MYKMETKLEETTSCTYRFAITATQRPKQATEMARKRGQLVLSHIEI